MASTDRKIPTEPPEHISDDEAKVWRDTIVHASAFAPIVDAIMLEAYCSLVVRWRSAAESVATEGVVVDGGEKRGAIVHPALAAERQLADQLKDWAPLFHRRPSPRRRSGPVYDATKTSMEAAQLDTNDMYAGACAGVLTLAWLIDEAQRDGIDELRKASYSVIPSYLKGCAELQITPASIPEDARKKAKSGGKLTTLQDAASRRRQSAG